MLDGKWHNVQCVRRWVGKSGAQLELWIDGRLIASQALPKRVDMQAKYWKDWGVGNPPRLKGWFFGGEEQALTGLGVDSYWNEYEDYKGLVDEMRFWNYAKSKDELKNKWKNAVTVKSKGLVGYYSFENVNVPGHYLVKGKIPKSQHLMALHKFGPENFSTQNAPVQ